MKNILLLVIPVIFIISFSCSDQDREANEAGSNNLAVVAVPSYSGRPGANLDAISDGIGAGQSSNQNTRPNLVTIRPGSQWIQYEWSQPVITGETEISWWADMNRVRPPKNYRLLYWNGSEFIPVTNASGMGLELKSPNRTTFDKVSTTILRLEAETDSNATAGLLEWAVIPSDDCPEIAPLVTAGKDRDVMSNGKTYLNASVRSVKPVKGYAWKKESGPGKVVFDSPRSLSSAATFSKPGEYVLSFTATGGKLKSSSSLEVKVVQPPPPERLEVVYTKPYKVDSPLWSGRVKAIITNWIPHCIDMINRTDLKTGQGGIDNFIEAGKALRGEPHGRHLGYVFSNAWVYQTIEAMSIALMVDPQNDPDIIKAQDKMKETLEEWIPIVLAAQEPDGYIQTAYTLRDTTRWRGRWEPRTRGNHEGYVAGYFIESAINHYTLTDGTDRRLYDAARRMADCWVDNIGPGKKEWYDGHQEMEQALVRFGRFVNDIEGNGEGDDYISLAKFLLDNRKEGSEYDQSHVPVQEQYEAVGHAVRAVYSYSAMADVAAETGDVDYQSAVMSLWDNIVNRKYYITGGVGSGETSEGFGPDYSLRNNAYCESCSSCGLIFFQYKMNIAYHDAKYADLYEETMFNALLGSLDLEGKNFTYTNALNSSDPRYDWHVCPCCVGNIPRTLLMIPTWTYLKSDSGIYVNLFIGSTIKVENIAGTDVEMVQETDYPWKGEIAVTVNPAEEREFTVYVRIPDRQTSELYTPVPEVRGFLSLKVNNEPANTQVKNGYAEIRRTWKRGDRIDIVLPLEVQRVTADERVAADRERMAIKFGPLVYNVETVDQKDIDQPIGDNPLRSEWKGDLLGGIVAINGTWTDGSPLVAIPNYSRNNRNQEEPAENRRGSIVWIRTK